MDSRKAARKRFTECVMTIAKPALVVDGDGMVVFALLTEQLRLSGTAAAVVPHEVPS